ncbi:hypothetical protein [Levilactobacillus brevis]|uniref:hypothetical protein n=1 Tax=Levilactobacillus brevis TaxID=1580 RepID=UPI0020CE8E4E|nr:hypothetical protein [Levilactobacillus brevis]MCP9614746.1 hypothetical protein [Levilactobacillus brevis]
MDIKKVVAVMAVKTNPKDKVGNARITGNGGLFSLDNTPEKEVEFYSETDFEDPKRKNFEDLIRELLSGSYKPEQNVTIHFLTEYK